MVIFPSIALSSASAARISEEWTAEAPAVAVSLQYALASVKVLIPSVSNCIRMRWKVAMMAIVRWPVFFGIMAMMLKRACRGGTEVLAAVVMIPPSATRARSGRLAMSLKAQRSPPMLVFDLKDLLALLICTGVAVLREG